MCGVGGMLWKLYTKLPLVVGPHHVWFVVSVVILSGLFLKRTKKIEVRCKVLVLGAGRTCIRE